VAVLREVMMAFSYRSETEEASLTAGLQLSLCGAMQMRHSAGVAGIAAPEGPS